MEDKTNKTNKPIDKKCLVCKHRDSKTNFCKLNNKDCCLCDFSKCSEFLVHEKLIMF